MNLGENIYRLRTSQNMSQGDLADALDVSRQSVSKWENNNAVPELDKLIKMSEIFGVSLDQLVNPEKTSDTSTVTAYTPEVPPQASSFPTRKILGILLLVCGVLCFVVPTLLGGILVGYLMGAPLIVIGAVLAFSPADWLFRICWLLFALMFPLAAIFGINFIRFDIESRITWIFLGTLAFLLLWTVLGLRKGRLSPSSKKVAIASIILVLALGILFSALLPLTYPKSFATEELHVDSCAYTAPEAHPNHTSALCAPVQESRHHGHHASSCGTGVQLSHINANAS